MTSGSLHSEKTSLMVVQVIVQVIVQVVVQVVVQVDLQFNRSQQEWGEFGF
jgi:hypothetical protein